MERVLGTTHLAPSRCCEADVERPTDPEATLLVRQRDGHHTVCIRDPGFDVNLYLTMTLRICYYVWRGDIPLSQALDEGRMEMAGEFGRAERFRVGLPDRAMRT